MQEEYSNQWHEQVTFSDLYFDITKQCRLSQIRNDYNGWYNLLYGKISLIRGVLNEKDKKIEETIADDLELIDGHWSEYLDLQLKCRRIEKYPDSRNLILLGFKKALFDVEARMDQIINKKMPFLNIKKKADITGL